MKILQMDQPLSITIIQTDLHWEDRQRNLAMLEKKIDGLKERSEVIILPEMFSTGFSMQPARLAETMNGEAVQWMKKMAAKKNSVITGSLIISETADGGALAYFNRLVWMLPNGEYGIYDKRHRFAYGGEDEQFTAGTKRLIASVKGWKINLLICYDLRFPVWARQQLGSEGSEYDLLIYVANWPERRVHAWKTLLQARAIENQCYVVGVNRVGDDGNKIHYSGESMVVDPMGEVLYSRKDEEDVFTITLDKAPLATVRQTLPFWKDADEFQIINKES